MRALKIGDTRVVTSSSSHSYSGAYPGIQTQVCVGPESRPLTSRLCQAASLCHLYKADYLRYRERKNSCALRWQTELKESAYGFHDNQKYGTDR